MEGDLLDLAGINYERRKSVPPGPPLEQADIDRMRTEFPDASEMSIRWKLIQLAKAA